MQLDETGPSRSNQPTLFSFAGGTLKHPGLGNLGIDLLPWLSATVCVIRVRLSDVFTPCGLFGLRRLMQNRLGWEIMLEAEGARPHFPISI